MKKLLLILRGGGRFPRGGHSFNIVLSCLLTGVLSASNTPRNQSTIRGLQRDSHNFIFLVVQTFQHRSILSFKSTPGWVINRVKFSLSTPANLVGSSPPLFHLGDGSSVVDAVHHRAAGCPVPNSSYVFDKLPVIIPVLQSAWSQLIDVF